MPYKLTRPIVSESQKRIELTWYRPCDCGGEYRVFCEVERPRGHVLIRCRDCKRKERIPKPVTALLTTMPPMIGRLLYKASESAYPDSIRSRFAVFQPEGSDTVEIISTDNHQIVRVITSAEWASKWGLEPGAVYEFSKVDDIEQFEGTPMMYVDRDMSEYIAYEKIAGYLSLSSAKTPIGWFEFGSNLILEEPATIGFSVKRLPVTDDVNEPRWRVYSTPREILIFEHSDGVFTIEYYLAHCVSSDARRDSYRIPAEPPHVEAAS